MLLRRAVANSGNNNGGIMLVMKLPGPSKMTSACSNAWMASCAALTMGTKKSDWGNSVKLSMLISPTILEPEPKLAAR